MVHFYAVPGCSDCSSADTLISHYALPLKSKKLLKDLGTYKIGRRKLPINANTNNHFVNAAGHRLWPDEYPIVNIPLLSTTVC